jgi:MerR family regulatory protein
MAAITNASVFWCERRKGLNTVCTRGYRRIGHIGRPSVVGVVGEPPQRTHLMCPWSISPKVLSGQSLRGLTSYVDTACIFWTQVRALTHLTISLWAKRARVNGQTVRYYERRGLLPEPSRRASGYRASVKAGQTSTPISLFS